MTVAIPRQTIKSFSQNQGKAHILETVGNLDNIKITQNFVLVATYIRPEKTEGGLWLPDSTLEEDVYQGKVGLVLKLGPKAYMDEEEDRFGEVYAVEGDWVVYRVGDAWDLTLNKVHCRLIRDSNIRLIIDDPESIF